LFSSLLVLSDASSFFCFVGALYVAWVLFYFGLFSVRTFFSCLLRDAQRARKREKTDPKAIWLCALVFV
jgi:hypothetical protein